MNMKTRYGRMALVCWFLTVGCVGACLAADPREAFEARQFESEQGRSIAYRLLTPTDLVAGETYPLVLFLHGAGERGDDNTAQLVHGMGNLCTDEMRARYPTFVVAPQCPRGQLWSNVNFSAACHQLSAEPSDPMAATMELLDALCDEYPVDRQRIYITGLSMGGYGTWDALARYPGKFAAAIPICGGGDSGQVEPMLRTPIWVVHGDEDRAVPVSRSRDMVDALRAAGGTPIYTEYPGVGHDSWTATYADRLLWDWLFAQRLAVD